MQNALILVIELHLRFINIGGIPLLFFSLEGCRSFHAGAIGMIRHIDSAEAVCRNIPFQPVIGTEAAAKHVPELFKAFLPGDLERDHLFRRHIFRLLLFQHHRRTAVAAEGSRRGVDRVNSRAAGGAGQQFHVKTASRLPGFLLIRLGNAHHPVTSTAFQLL